VIVYGLEEKDNEQLQSNVGDWRETTDWGLCQSGREEGWCSEVVRPVKFFHVQRILDNAWKLRTKDGFKIDLQFSWSVADEQRAYKKLVEELKLKRSNESDKVHFFKDRWDVISWEAGKNWVFSFLQIPFWYFLYLLFIFLKGSFNFVWSLLHIYVFGNPSHFIDGSSFPILFLLLFCKVCKVHSWFTNIAFYAQCLLISWTIIFLVMYRLQAMIDYFSKFSYVSVNPHSRSWRALRNVFTHTNKFKMCRYQVKHDWNHSLKIKK
jgi:hypothetical protein